MQSDRRGVGVTCHKCILFVYKTDETWDRKMNDFLEFLFLYGGGRLEASVVPPVVHPPIFWRQPAPMKPGQGLLWAWTGLLGTGPGPLSNGTLLPGLTLLPVWGLERPTWDRAWSTPKRDFIIATSGFVFAVLDIKKNLPPPFNQ